MTGASGGWGGSVDLSLPTEAVHETVERLMSARTVPPSESFRPARGTIVLRARDPEGFTLRYLWHQQCFVFRVVLAAGSTSGAHVRLSARPEIGNPISYAVAIVGCGAWVAYMAHPAFGVVAAGLMALYSWWLARESGRHACNAAEALLGRIGRDTLVSDVEHSR